MKIYFYFLSVAFRHQHGAFLSSGRCGFSPLSIFWCIALCLFTTIESQAQFYSMNCGMSNLEASYNGTGSNCEYIVTVSVSSSSLANIGTDYWQIEVPGSGTAIPSCGMIETATYSISTMVTAPCSPVIEFTIKEVEGVCSGTPNGQSCGTFFFPPAQNNPSIENTNFNSITENSVTDVGGGNCEYDVSIDLVANTSIYGGRWELLLPAGVAATSTCGNIPAGLPVQYNINTVLTKTCGISDEITVREYSSSSTCPVSYPTNMFGMNGQAFAGSLLPVELNYFDGKLDRGGVNLRWETATEVDNEGFEIQRSGNGSDWIKIGFVEGAGTSPSANQYAFVDRQPFSGKSYYRFKQMDFDGHFEFSKTISINNGEGGKGEVHFFPNPVEKGTAHIFLPEAWEGDARCQIFNLMEEVVFQQTISPGGNQLNINHLPAGVYSLDVGQGSLFQHSKNSGGRVARHG